MRYQDQEIAVVLTALYLPGINCKPPLPRMRWRRVDALLRAQSASLETASKLLSRAGFWLEASALGVPGLLNQAQCLLSAGNVLTACSPLYPQRWLTLLGHSAPPVFWCAEEIPSSAYITVVGSRHPDKPARSFAIEMGRTVIRQGACLVSGAAQGIDRAAARGAMAACHEAGIEPLIIEILPHGIELGEPASHCRLSAVAPREPFSAAAAMERNALLYAASPRSLVIAPRLRQGGAWIGARECLRRRLSHLCVYDDQSTAARALIALGARGIVSPCELFEQEPKQEAHLFHLSE